MKRLRLLILISLTALGLAPALPAANIVPLPGHPNRPESPRYKLTVDGLPVTVRDERFNFDVGMFDLAKPAVVEIDVLSDFATANLKPDRHGLKLEREGNKLRFTLGSPLKLVLQIDTLQPLAILATPPETAVPAKGDANVLYFGPGITNAGIIRPQSGQTIYLAPGALVKGRVEAKNVSKVSIRGRGILETTGHSKREDKTHGLLFDHCRDITIEGIGVRAFHTWWQTLFLNSRDIEVSHLNLLGIGVNTDGIDIDGVRDFVVRDTFIRCEDDGLGWHALDAAANGEPNAERAVARDLVIWNTGAGNGIRLGASMETQLWRDIVIENVDILMHADHGAGIYSDFSDWAWAQDVVFRNITIERPKSPIVFKILKTHYSNSTGFLDERGNIERLLFENVTMKGGRIAFAGFDANHRIDQVHFNNCTNAGAPVRSLSDITINSHVTNVRFNTPLPALPATPAGRHEAELLESATNTRPQITYRDETLSGGKGRELRATADGDYVDYAVEKIPAGTYRLKLGVKRTPASAKFSLTVNGAAVGSEQDLHAAKDSAAVVDFGPVTLKPAERVSIRLTVSGQNSASTRTDRRLDVDYIDLTPVR